RTQSMQIHVESGRTKGRRTHVGGYLPIRVGAVPFLLNKLCPLGKSAALGQPVHRQRTASVVGNYRNRITFTDGNLARRTSSRWNGVHEGQYIAVERKSG